MIITEEIDLCEFRAWSGGAESLDTLKKAEGCGVVQDFLEECYPEGMSSTRLNDYLWFEVENDFPKYFYDYSDMEEAEDEVEELNKDPSEPFMRTSDGTLYRLTTYRDNDDDPREVPTLKLAATKLSGDSNDLSHDYEIDYDLSDSLNDNILQLKEEMATDGTYPALPPDMEYVEDFPCWAIVMFANSDSSGLEEADIYTANVWAAENGYGMIEGTVNGTHAGFNSYPAFGLACDTETVVMTKIDHPIYLIQNLDSDKYLQDDASNLVSFRSEDDAKKWLLDQPEEEREHLMVEKVYDPGQENSNE